MRSNAANALQVVRQWQSPTEKIRHAPEPLAARIGVWTLALLLLTALAATPFIHIERVVPSQTGKIVSKQALTTFQALDPSIVGAVDVKEGQQVVAGQILATLDPTFTTADVGQSRQEIAALDAQIARAQAELDGRPFSANPGGAAETPYLGMQKALYAQRASQYASQLKSFDEKIDNTRATLVKLQGDNGRFGERDRISQQVETMRNTLFSSGASSLLSLLQATDARLQVLVQLDNTRISLVETQHQLAALQADRAAFVAQWSVTTGQELVKARDQRDVAVASLQKAIRHQDLVRVTAPEDAVVLRVSKVSAGSVLKQGDEVMQLAPLAAPIEAEIALPASDIGYVRPGDPVSLKIDAFNAFEHGMAQGHLAWISEGAFTTDENGQPVPPYYRARVAIDDLHFRDMPAAFRLVPGMTLAADVDIGSRSAFRYILGGFLRGLGEPMRTS